MMLTFIRACKITIFRFSYQRKSKLLINSCMTPKPDFNSLIEQLIEKGPTQLDLTDEEHAEAVYEAAKELFDLGISIGDIETLEPELLKENDDQQIFILLVLKILRSKLLVSSYKDPLRVSVVFAVYKEHNRIRKKGEHPHGENFLVKKVEQLNWLFEGKPNIKWNLTVVDDGCPERSGFIAQEIIKNEGLQEQARVLFLSDAIKYGLEPAKALLSTNDSQKGGSIVYGMWDAVQNYGTENHIVAFTDADLSTHLGQLGLLIEPITGNRKLAAIGSRRETDSVVIKTGARNTRGKLFIYLWKRLIPNLGEIVDTQCGFKAFNTEIIPEITHNLIEKKFAFDIELLLRTALIEANGISKVGIAWIDSEAASTTTELSPYLPMLKSIVKMYLKYFESNPETEEYTQFIEGLSEEDFMDLLDHIPKEILEREPHEFTEYDQVKASDLVASIRK